MATNRNAPSDYKTNYHRYRDCIDEIGTAEFYRVFHWLYKGGNEYVGDFLSKTYNLNKIIHISGNRKKLEERTPTEDMDISCLYNLMQYACGLSPAEGHIWDQPEECQKDSLEHLLYQLKEHRNELHEHMILRKRPEKDMALKMEMVCGLCRNILTKAGEICGKLQEASTAIMNLENDFKLALGVTPEHIAALGKDEKIKQYEDDNADMEYYSMPIMHYKGVQLPLSDLLSVKLDEDQHSNVIIVRGDAGTGKSSVCQYLDWLWTNGKDNNPWLQLYDLALVIPCQDISTSDIRHLLLDELLPETMKWCDPTRICQHLDELNVLWIIDSLDESTNVATDLVHGLLKKQNTKHTFVIASRHEHTYSIMRDLQPYEFSEVILYGVNPREMIEKLVNSEVNSHYVPSDLSKLLSNYEQLSNEVKQEFHNPLKLTYAMKNWEEACKLQQGFSLTELYEIIRNAQIVFLSKKFTRGMLTENDATCRVTTWFNCLCKIAFQASIFRNDLELGKENLKNLQEECCKLLLPSSEACLSSFLAYSGSGKYNFFHSTQKYYLAALHCVSKFNDCNDYSEFLEELGFSELNTHSKELSNLHEVLLHMILLVKDSVSEEEAQYLMEIVNFSITDSNSSPKWFEVVKIGGYKEKFLHPIIEFLPDLWFVCDKTVIVADRLLNYFEPSHIVFDIQEDPEKSEGLKSLLHKVSLIEIPVYVELMLRFHALNPDNTDNSNGFLRLLCHDRSNCQILVFIGHLTNEGYDLLNYCDIWEYCQIICLKLSECHCLTPLCRAIQNFGSIERIELIFAFQEFQLRDVPCELPAWKVKLTLLQLTDEEVRNAVILLKSMTKGYDVITVHNLSLTGAENFVYFAQRKLLRTQRKLLKANHFIRAIPVTGSYTSVDLGNLPLMYYIEHFRSAWKNSELFRYLRITVELEYTEATENDTHESNP